MSPPEAVRVERSGAVTTVVLDRPARRNAVDRPTAALLADAFRDFDADPTAEVAVLWVGSEPVLQLLSGMGKKGVTMVDKGCCLAGGMLCSG